MLEQEILVSFSPDCDKNFALIVFDLTAQCVQRWTRSLRPGLVKGRWSTEEDKTLTRLVRSYPDVYLVPWKSLVDHIPGRTSKQCRERWFNFLDPSLKRTGHWSKAEDAKLWQLSQTYGRKWSQIARELPGRTENGVKVRYNALDRNFKRLGEVPTAPVAEESTQNDEANSSNSSAASVNSSSSPARQTTTMASLVSPTPITNTTSQEANLNSKTTTTLTAMLPPVSYSSNMLTNAVKNSPPLLSSNPFLGSLGGVVDSSNTASNKKRDREDEVDVSQETCVSLPGKKISALPTPLSIQFLNSSGFGSVALPLTSTSVGANGFVNNSTVSYLSQSPILSAPSLLQQYDRPNSSSQATSTTSGTAVSQSTGSVSKTPGSCTSSNALLQQALYSQLQTQAQLTQQSIPQATFVSSYNPAAIAQVLHQQREVQQVQSQIEQLHSQLAQLQQLQQLQQMKYLQTAMQLQQQQMMILPTGLNMNGGVPGFPSSLGMGQLPSSISSNNGAFVVSGMQQIDPATLAQFSWPTNFQG